MKDAFSPIRNRATAYTQPTQVKGKKKFRIVVCRRTEGEWSYHPLPNFFPNRITANVWFVNEFVTAEQFEAWANGFFLSKPKKVRDDGGLKYIEIPNTTKKAVEIFVSQVESFVKDLEYEVKDGSFPDEIENTIWNLSFFGIIATVKGKKVSYAYDPKVHHEWNDTCKANRLGKDPLPSLKNFAREYIGQCRWIPGAN